MCSLAVKASSALQLPYVLLPHQTGGIMASTEKPSKDVTKVAALVCLDTTPEEKVALYDQWKDYDKVGVLFNLMCE